MKKLALVVIVVGCIASMYAAPNIKEQARIIRENQPLDGYATTSSLDKSKDDFAAFDDPGYTIELFEKESIIDLLQPSSIEYKTKDLQKEIMSFIE